jgi:hypothetical protein
LAIPKFIWALFFLCPFLATNRFEGHSGPKQPGWIVHGITLTRRKTLPCRAAPWLLASFQYDFVKNANRNFFPTCCSCCCCYCCCCCCSGRPRSVLPAGAVRSKWTINTAMRTTTIPYLCVCGHARVGDVHPPRTRISGFGVKTLRTLEPQKSTTDRPLLPGLVAPATATTRPQKITYERSDGQGVCGHGVDLLRPLPANYPQTRSRKHNALANPSISTLHSWSAVTATVMCRPLRVGGR